MDFRDSWVYKMYEAHCDTGGDFNMVDSHIAINKAVRRDLEFGVVYHEHISQMALNAWPYGDSERDHRFCDKTLIDILVTVCGTTISSASTLGRRYIGDSEMGDITYSWSHKSKEEITKLAMAHRYLYYCKADPVMSDWEYDMMEEHLLPLIENDKDNPINKPGSDWIADYSKETKILAAKLLRERGE